MNWPAAVRQREFHVELATVAELKMIAGEQAQAVISG
jgi:hypothetical protein